MNNYTEILKTAKHLRDEFKELTIYQSLEIASKIQQCEVLSAGLLVQGTSPVALEAIAMVLGFNPGDSNMSTITDSLERLSYIIDEKG